MLNRLILDMDDAQAAVADGRRYGITIKPVPGGSPPPSGNVEITGEYDDVMAYLTDGCGLSDEEAESYMDTSESFGDDEEEDQLSARRAPSGRQFEGFDKFMDRIVLDERKNIVPRETEKSPQRIRAERNQDRPGNKIRYGRVK